MTNNYAVLPLDINLDELKKLEWDDVSYRFSVTRKGEESPLVLIDIKHDDNTGELKNVYAAKFEIIGNKNGLHDDCGMAFGKCQDETITNTLDYLRHKEFETRSPFTENYKLYRDLRFGNPYFGYIKEPVLDMGKVDYGWGYRFFTAGYIVKCLFTIDNYPTFI